MPNDDIIRFFEQGTVGLLDAEDRVQDNGTGVKLQRVATIDATILQVILLEYYNPGDGQNRLRYLGIAPMGSAQGDPVWSIRQFTWSPGPILGAYVVTQIENLVGSWSGRAGLPW